MKMLSIEVLGPGCPNCHDVEALVRRTAASMSLEATVESVADFREITKCAILATPGLVMGERVVNAAGCRARPRWCPGWRALVATRRIDARQCL